MKKVVLVVALGILMLLKALPVGAVDPEKGFAFNDKVVLAYYYIWYDESKWLETRQDHLAGLFPLAGAYNSWEPCIIEKHLRQMQRAKIDAVACSWWEDPAPNSMNDKLGRIYDLAENYGLKITIDFEHGQSTLEEIYRELSYFLKRFQDHRSMLKVDGLPVVMIWSAWAHTPDEWRGIFTRLEAEGMATFPIMSGSYRGGNGAAYLNPFRSLEEYTLVDIEDSQLAGFMQTMRGHVDAYNKKEGFKNGKPAQHHATISPGYDERLLQHRQTRHGGWLGAGWKDRTKFGVNYPDDPEGAYYRGTFEAAMSSNPDWLHVSTFNELYERSHIEATVEHGYFYIDLTAEFVEIFKNSAKEKKP